MNHQLRATRLLTTTRRTLFTSSTATRTGLPSRLANYSKGILLLGSLLGSYAYITDTRATIHSWLSVPLIKLIANDDPEQSHQIAIKILSLLSKLSIIRDTPQPNDKLLSFELWGKEFNNPIGLAAGFDKHGDAIDGLFDIGFGYVEIGSITPEAQPGNPKPRMFRIPSSESIINRYGFNSEGHLSVLSKLRQRVLKYIDTHRHLGYSAILSQFDNLNSIQTLHPNPAFTHLTSPSLSLESSTSIDHQLSEIIEKFNVPKSLRTGRILGINLGKNKVSAQDSIEDYVTGIERFHDLADLLIINISSPNTPGLRSLQSKQTFQRLLDGIDMARLALELVDIGTLAKQSKIDGIIVSNTTTSRPIGSGTGGLSGPPLKNLSLRALSIIYEATSGSIPLIGCGGISSAEDVLEYGKAGASFNEDGKTWRDVVGSQAKKIDLGKLIQEDNVRCFNQNFDAQVDEIKQSIRVVDEHIKRISNRSPSSTPSSSLETKKTDGLVNPSSSSLATLPTSTGGDRQEQDRDGDGDGERGILATWKRNRKNQS
ncbi:hypothetical protein PSHT_11175 [Puccinia striiformis]|uniref:Dihydroorotate dehydrogenase (quinone), mitochondrial n=1 Tax=Puccinia striiformis TaxID=27350 RepID=A0A2S4V585_9BASI|nr:hypothetical protein PSHT_11175 [Puccinia striiformis]